MMEFYKFSYIFLFSLILVVSISDGRKDLGKYWVEKMKGQPVPEAIVGLINQGPSENMEVKGYGLTMEKPITKEFDPIPNVTAYHDDGVNSNEVISEHDESMGKKPYMDAFEPRPNISIYND